MSMNHETAKLHHREQVGKPGSIPFVWEEKPGLPKENYTIQTTIYDPLPSAPEKLVISVPFRWEEEPGKPKPCPSAAFDHLLLYSPVSSIREEEDDDDHSDEKDDDDGEDFYVDFHEGGGDEDDELFELDFESFAFDVNDLPVKCLSPSTPTMLANSFSTASDMSNAIPIEHLVSQRDYRTSSGSGQGTSSTEDDDTSYIEFHFPLVTPHSGFLQKVFAMEDQFSEGSRQASARKSCCRVKCVKVKRMPPTLGELMFPSCRGGKPRRKSSAPHNKNHHSSQVVFSDSSFCYSVNKFALGLSLCISLVPIKLNHNEPEADGQ